MPVRPDMPCADCGKLMWRSPSSLPAGQARCQPCRRLRPTVPRGRATDAQCEACQQPITSRQANRYCSVKCANGTLNRARAKGGSRSPRSCPTCGKTFTPSGSRQVTCSRGCRRPVVTRTRVPGDHPSKWVGDSSPVRYATCAWCDETVVLGPSGAASRRTHCSEYCVRRMKKQRRTSRMHGTPQHQTWTWGAFMRMAAKFNYCCAYCGTKPERLDPDHVVPLSNGGSNALTNLLPSCLACNSDKRDLSLAGWALDRERRGLSACHTTWSLGDARYVHLAVLQGCKAA